MPLSDIKELEVPATSDAVLYLWATAPKLKEAFAVIEAWDFEYKTNIVWDKEQIGMGYWARGQHEHLLIAGRGDISPPDVDDRRSSVVSPQTVHENRRQHSRKPDCVLDMIADQHEGADIIEMFARQGRESVDSWGAEAPAEVSDDD
jgi:N6-adenosine-specific RNA methylase IME4